MHPFIILLLLIAVAALLSDLFAHRDELAARRFRELNPATVGSELDKSRNRRWHRVGFWHRLAVAALVALAGACLGVLSWAKFGAALLVAGATISLTFDVFFNLRFGQRWDYAGTTAWFDEWLGKVGAAGAFNAGRAAALVEAAGVLVGGWWWLAVAG